MKSRTKRPGPGSDAPPSRGPKVTTPQRATRLPTVEDNKSRHSRILILTLSVCLHQLNRALDLRRLLERLVAHGLDLLHGALDDLVLRE